MRIFTKRLQKKFLNRAINGLLIGEPNRFYLMKLIDYVGSYYYRKYLTEFRPWWYDNFENWKEYDFVKESKNHFDRVSRELEGMGIPMNLVDDWVKKQPKRNRNRKPRKEKQKPIRKLRNPQEYEISVRKFGEVTKEKVIGEFAFRYGEHDFFIHRYQDHWRVSDVAIGAAVTSYHDSYRKAIDDAKKKISSNYESYVEMVEKYLKGA